MNKSKKERLFGDHFRQGLTEAEQALIEQVRELCREHIGPNAAAVAQEDRFSWDTFHLLARSGVLATAFPKKYGGSEARQVVRIRILEELGRTCSTAASMVTGADLSTRAIVAGASERLKEQLLPQLCTGKTQCAFALTEPGAGSDVRGIQTKVHKEGSRYVISGSKKFITRASTADWFVVIGRLTESDAKFVALIVPRDAPGLTISEDEPKLGWYGVPIASLELRDVAIANTHRLGEEGDGFNLAQDALLRARIGHAGMALGRAMGALEIASSYVVERQVSGKRLSEHQGVQWMLAEMVVQVEATRALLTLTAEKYDREAPDVALFASMVKLQATDLCMKVVTDALQLTGGRGFLKAFPLERFFRDAKLNQIGEGSSEVHKTIIGRDIVRRAVAAERHPCLKPGPLVDY